MAKSKSTKKAAQRAAKAPSGAEVVRIGLQAATAKANMDPKKWGAIVKAAHGRGFTVGSAIDPNIPDALKSRTKSSLKTQANQTIQEAYAPQEKELDYATTQANGLRTKRLSDEAGFNSWYAQQVSQMNERTQAAQQAYEQAAGANADPTHQGSVAQTSQANQAQLATDVQKGAGGDMSNSVYLKDAQAREQTRADAATRQATAAKQSGIQTANNMNAASASIAGRHSGAVGEIEGDFGKTNSDLTAARLKMSSSKASDSIKAYTDLLDQETSKASSQQQYSGLVAQLTQKADAQQQQNQQFYAGLQASDKKSQRDATVATGNNVRTNSTALTVANINATSKALDRDLKKSQGALDRANALRIAAKSHPGQNGVPSQAEIANSRQQVQVAHTIADIIHTYGSKFRDKQGHVTDTRKALISRGYSTPQINAGLYLAKYGRIKDPSIYKQLGILPQDRG
jgi:hypothetical protein